MTEEASRDSVEAALESWTPEQIACRAYQHTWRPLSVQHRPGVYTVTHRCTRCRIRRTQDIDDYGYVLTPWKIDYRDTGYLLKGQGRVGFDGRAVLRLASLKALPIKEMDEEE